MHSQRVSVKPWGNPPKTAPATNMKKTHSLTMDKSRGAAFRPTGKDSAQFNKGFTGQPYAGHCVWCRRTARHSPQPERAERPGVAPAAFPSNRSLRTYLSTDPDRSQIIYPAPISVLSQSVPRCSNLDVSITLVHNSWKWAVLLRVGTSQSRSVKCVWMPSGFFQA